MVTVDGTDFRIWEPKHPILPIDKGYCSHKMKHAALRYEIAICLKTSKVVWVSGPHRGGKSDLQIFNEGLSKKIQDGKKVIADGGYSGNRKIAKPDELNFKELQNLQISIITNCTKIEELVFLLKSWWEEVVTTVHDRA